MVKREEMQVDRGSEGWEGARPVQGGAQCELRQRFSKWAPTMGPGWGDFR